MDSVRKILLGVLLYFGCLCNVLGDECDSTTLKKLAQNVEIKHDYLGMFEDVDNGGFLTDKYHVVIQGITQELSLEVDDGSLYPRVYQATDATNGTIEFDTFLKKINFSVYALGCSGNAIRTIPLELKTRNLYAYDDRCQELKKYNLDVCDEWYQGDITTDEFYAITDKYYSNGGKTGTFFHKNRFLIWGLILIITIGIGIVFGVNYWKRSVLK